MGPWNLRSTSVVVCGVDGSRVAVEALRTEREFAGALGLRLGANDMASGEALLDRACARADVPDAERRIVTGRPAERLAWLAGEERAELIAVGSRGHRLLRAALVGGVSSELIGLTTCPVLVIPAHALP